MPATDRSLSYVPPHARTRSLPTRTPAEHRAIRFLSFSQNAAYKLQQRETQLTAKLRASADRAELETQLADVRVCIARTERNRRRAVAELRAAEAKAGHHHHHDCDRWSRLGVVRSALAPSADQLAHLAQPGAYATIAARCDAIGNAGVDACLATQSTRYRRRSRLRRFTPSEARRRHRPYAVHQSRAALSQERAIATARSNGEWMRMHPRHRMLQLAMLRWRQAGGPFEQEPGADVQPEQWLTPADDRELARVFRLATLQRLGQPVPSHEGEVRLPVAPFGPGRCFDRFLVFCVLVFWAARVCWCLVFWCFEPGGRGGGWCLVFQTPHHAPSPRAHTTVTATAYRSNSPRSATA